MKKKKLELNKFTVSSFLTSVDAEQLLKLKGGTNETPTMDGGSCLTVFQCCVNGG